MKSAVQKNLRSRTNVCWDWFRTRQP